MYLCSVIHGVFPAQHVRRENVETDNQQPNNARVHQGSVTEQQHVSKVPVTLYTNTTRGLVLIPF